MYGRVGQREQTREIKGKKVAVVTGAGSGIGQAAAFELANRGVRVIALVDRSDAVHSLSQQIRQMPGQPPAMPFVGDTTDSDFRRRVFDELVHTAGAVNICVPAAGITRDALAVRLDKSSGKVTVCPEEYFRLVVEVNLIAPAYWALEMVARVAEDRVQRGLGKWTPNGNIQGTIIFIGSISSQGNKGQIANAICFMISNSAVSGELWADAGWHPGV